MLIMLVNNVSNVNNQYKMRMCIYNSAMNSMEASSEVALCMS